MLRVEEEKSWNILLISRYRQKRIIQAVSESEAPCIYEIYKHHACLGSTELWNDEAIDPCHFDGIYDNH